MLNIMDILDRIAESIPSNEAKRKAKCDANDEVVKLRRDEASK
jgi:hypothetical protein